MTPPKRITTQSDS